MCISVIITSPRTENYNCFAWAAGSSSEWWNPFDIDNDYWPDGVLRKENLEAYILAYNWVGYHRIALDDFELEIGFEKIAIYANTVDKISHAARQLSDGSWTSKIGIYQDVRHEFVEDFTSVIEGRGSSYGSILESVDYGRVVAIMKRPISAVNREEEASENQKL
jgi:hypothetical protein